MPVFNNILAGAAGQTGGAAAAGPIKSLRFNSGDSAYLNRTPSSAGNRKTFTFSAWVKKTEIISSGDRQIFGSDSSGGAEFNGIAFVSTNALNFRFNDSGSLQIRSSALHRDPSAWLHIVCAADTSQATASDRLKMYVNGAEVTDFSSSTYPSQNAESSINSTQVHEIGRRAEDGGQYFNGYLADIHFIDGSALDPTSFGAFDDNGVWQAAAYSGSFGTNGFHLFDFANEATVGHDSSGNSNDFTANNLSDTAGAGNDVLLDFPVNGSESDTGAGGEVSGNYCCWNPLFKAAGLSSNGTATFTNGNLEVAAGGGTWTPAAGTIAVTSGKWYAEFEITSLGGSNHVHVGISPPYNNFSGVTYHSTSQSGHFYGSDGQIWSTGSPTTGYTTSAVGDIIGVALDFTASTVTFTKNGSSIGSVSLNSNITSNGAVFAADLYPTGSVAANWGQRSFAYSAPSNHKALCTTNLPTPTIADGSDHFYALASTGTFGGGTVTDSDADFTPDLVWVKRRNAAERYKLYDILRGTDGTRYKHLESDGNDAEGSGETGITAFVAGGYTSEGGGHINSDGQPFISWMWNAGTSTASNTDGSVTSSVRANASAGFSIVKYTGTSASTNTIGHGLNAEVKFIMLKSNTAADNWFCYHIGLDASSPANYDISLNTTGARRDYQTWNDTKPTNSVFSVGNTGASNENGRGYIAYCFAPVAGYSAMGSYEGNSSTDGPFIYTGFRVAWLMIKNITDSGWSWNIYDTSRDPINANNKLLRPDYAASEIDAYAIDFLSNGFKLKWSDGSINHTSKDYIYIALAENPFQANGGLAR